MSRPPQPPTLHYDYGDGDPHDPLRQRRFPRQASRQLPASRSPLRSRVSAGRSSRARSEVLLRHDVEDGAPVRPGAPVFEARLRGLGYGAVPLGADPVVVGVVVGDVVVEDGTVVVVVGAVVVVRVLGGAVPDVVDWD